MKGTNIFSYEALCRAIIAGSRAVEIEEFWFDCIQEMKDDDDDVVDELIKHYTGLNKKSKDKFNQLVNECGEHLANSEKDLRDNEVLAGELDYLVNKKLVEFLE